jgi:hypothetical protein
MTACYGAARVHDARLVARMSEAKSGAKVTFPDDAFAHPGYEVHGQSLLPSQMRRGGDAIEALQRQNRIGELVGAVLQHRAGER